MRFPKRWFYRAVKRIEAFNSLYEIRGKPFIVEREKVVETFNSLYEIPNCWKPAFSASMLTFNSLYEILDIDNYIQRKASKNFQFSLWDSESRKGGGKNGK